MKTNCPICKRSLTLTKEKTFPKHKTQDGKSICSHSNILHVEESNYQMSHNGYSYGNA